MPVLINPFWFVRWPIWNASDKDSDISLSNDDRTWTQSSGANFGSVRSTTSINGLSRYVELVCDLTGDDREDWRFGIANASHAITSAPGFTSNSWAIDAQSDRWNNNSSVSLGSNLSNGDVVMLAFDGARLWFGVNGSWLNGGNPAAGTSPAFSGLSGSMFLIAGADSGGGTRRGTLARALTYAPPSGFAPGW